MGTEKSLDQNLEVQIIIALLTDVQTKYSKEYTPRAYRLDCKTIERRYAREGISFLTKALPRLARSLDRALAGNVSLDAAGFRKIPGSKLPRFLGWLFQQVFASDGRVLPYPAIECISALRQVLFVFYKYELAYDAALEQEVVKTFCKVEDELLDTSAQLAKAAREADCGLAISRGSLPARMASIAVGARTLLSRLFVGFDARDIVPGHGPGAVSTREKLWEKWHFDTVPTRITDQYPLDEYFYASLGHVCDAITDLEKVGEAEAFARVCLVPKDSRGPRLISCEPLAFQWIQQGLRDAIYQHVERHPLTKWNVRFTDQEPNRFAALHGSKTGKYATLDLKEASDRVSLGLVELLFPAGILPYLECSRSSATELPGGQYISLTKFAPMGSALCFPIMALTIWALLTAASSDTDTRESIYVYGDDVIVPTAQAENAIEVLEMFGLLVNRNKSFSSGFFRESCGCDAFGGVDVTPVKIKQVWNSSPCPHTYSAWISYANSLFSRKYYHAYWKIADALFRVYKEIPETVPERERLSLPVVPLSHRPKSKRWNEDLQRSEIRAWTVRSTPVSREIDGWAMLLRFFTEGKRVRPSHEQENYKSQSRRAPFAGDMMSPFDVRSYTERQSIKLVRRWQ